MEPEKELLMLVFAHEFDATVGNIGTVPHQGDLGLDFTATFAKHGFQPYPFAAGVSHGGKAL